MVDFQSIRFLTRLKITMYVHFLCRLTDLNYYCHITKECLFFAYRRPNYIYSERWHSSLYFNLINTSPVSRDIPLRRTVVWLYKRPFFKRSCVQVPTSVGRYRNTKINLQPSGYQKPNNQQLIRKLEQI